MFPDVPENLSELTDEELTELHDQLVAAFNEATAEDAKVGDDDVAALAGVADSIDRIRGEQTTRDEAAAARSAQLAELASRVNKADDKSDGEGEGEGDAAAEGDAQQPSNQDGQPSIPAEGAPAADTGQRTVQESGAPAANPGADGGVTAGATLQQLQRKAPARTKPRETAPEDTVSITASASGTKLNNLSDIATELVNRHRTLGRGNEDNVPVVTLSQEFPSDRYFSAGMSPDDVKRKIESFDRTPQGIQAAGGLCAPVNSYYGQMVIADAARPVRDALANFGADRGGIRFNPPPKLSQISSGVGTVTAAQDLAGGGGANKNCFTVTCPTLTEVDVTAVYNCLTFGNFGARAFPEQVEAWTQLALALQARTAEQMLLDGIAAASTTVTTAGLVGAGREILARMGQAAAGYRSRNRMQPGAPLRVLLPGWVLDLIRSDLARTFGDDVEEFSLANAAIENFLNVRNLNVTWYLDSKTGGGQVFGQAQGGQTYTDGVTNGTTTVTSATATFTSADVGKTIVGTNIPAGATIASVTNATTVVISAAATGSGSGISLTIGRTTLAQYPTTVYAYLFAEGSFLHLDAGTLDLGLVRDSTLNTTNQFRMFTESFENVALVGPESLEVVMTLNADGSYGAAKTITLPINS